MGEPEARDDQAAAERPVADISPAGTALPAPVERWRKRSVAGAILTGVALGLQDALTRQREEPAIVMDAPGEPPGPPQPVELRLDPDSPGGTVVILRPWLMPGDGGDAPAAD